MLFMLWRGRSKVVSDKHINFILRKTTLEKLSIAAFSLGRASKKSLIYKGILLAGRNNRNTIGFFGTVI